MSATNLHFSVDSPAGDLARSHPANLAAFRRSVARSAVLWRRVNRPEQPVPGLRWTAAETAAHVVGDLRDYTQTLTRHTNGYLTHANRPMQSPSRLSAAVNARHLTEVPERDLSQLAGLLEDAAEAYLGAAAAADTEARIATPNGLIVDAPTMTSLLLGEQLIHGLDIARAAKSRWPIEGGDALAVVPAVLAIAPQYLRPGRAAGVHCSFELRMRGGARYRMVVDNGAAAVGAAAGQNSDCVITADPVAFLLLGYGRIPMWSPVVRGQLRAGGRKPWLAMKFATLLESP